MQALKTMFDNLHVPQKLTPNIVALVRKMAKASDVRLEEWDDNFLASPFTPSGLGPRP